MTTAACHPAQADRFLRRARAPTAGNPPAVAASRPPDAIAASAACLRQTPLLRGRRRWLLLPTLRCL